MLIRVTIAKNKPTNIAKTQNIFSKIPMGAYFLASKGSEGSLLKADSELEIKICSYELSVWLWC